MLPFYFSDETVDDSGMGASSILGRGRGGWRGANANVFRAKAKAKDDVTYIPTPVLRSKMSSNSLARERPVIITHNYCCAET